MAFEFIKGIINRCSWLLRYYSMQTYIPEFPPPLLLSPRFYLVAHDSLNCIVVRSIHFAGYRSIKKRIKQVREAKQA